MGSTIEAEKWQPEKVSLNKMNNTINTYLAATNYWIPLYNSNKEDKAEDEEIHMLQQSIKTDQRPKSNKWTRRIERQKEQQLQKKLEDIIINLGDTSHFVSETLDLPQTGPAQITVYLPDDSTLKATSKTKLPFQQLSSEAREANIL